MNRCVRSKIGHEIRTTCGKIISSDYYGISESGNCIFCGKQIGTNLNLRDKSGDIIEEWNLYPITYNNLCEIVGYSRLNFEEKTRYLEERRLWYCKELKGEKDTTRRLGLKETINSIKKREIELYKEEFERKDKIEREQRKINKQIYDIATFIQE